MNAPKLSDLFDQQTTTAGIEEVSAAFANIFQVAQKNNVSLFVLHTMFHFYSGQVMGNIRQQVAQQQAAQAAAQQSGIILPPGAMQ